MGKKTKIQAGTKGIRAHWLDTELETEDQAPIEDPNPNNMRDGIKPGQWKGAPWDNMPPDCPFEILGENGDIIYVRTATHRLMEVKAIDHQTVMRMCAPYPNWALWSWPGFGSYTDPETSQEKVVVKRLERDKAATAIIKEAARRGTFDPQQSVRGRGGWRVGENFVWHAGERLWTVHPETVKEETNFQLRRSPPVSLEGKLYAKGAQTYAPWMTSIEERESPAHQILADLTSWNWHRAWLDPLLVLGWIAEGFMGGALKKRPIIALTGGRGRGKSTLIAYIEAIYGPIIYSTKDTTAAGIYQNMRQDSRPVLIDEFEAKAGSSREQPIIELARHSYDGSNINRGSSDHEGIQFQMYSAFFLAGINLPPFEQQDKSRMALLNLNPLTVSGAEPVVQEEWGRMLLRQVMDGWPRLQREILPKWNRILHKAGFDARAIDTYGTLIASAELLVGINGMVDIGLNARDEEWTVAALRSATAVELEEQTEKWQDVVERILSTSIDQWKSGERHTVGGVLEMYERQAMGLDDARASLAIVGLGLRPSGQPGQGHTLAIPHSGPQLEKIFEATSYYRGGWSNVLKQAPAEIVMRDLDDRFKSIKINRQAKKCLLVDMVAYDKATVPDQMAG